MIENDLVELTADIVSAYVANNSVPAAQIGELISSVHTSLNRLETEIAGPVVPESSTPAVSVKKSVTPNAITCLFCGRKFKSLKKHLSVNHGMTPNQYRAHWALPHDYPIVAPEYAARRSSLALSLGLGRKAMAPESVAEPTKPAKRGRPKKTA